MAICKIEGCEKGVYVVSKQLCSVHYNRLRTTGTTDPSNRARGTVEERFWRNVDKRTSDECWNWIGKSKIDGYGTIGLGGQHGKKILSHRLSWKIHFGDIPEGNGYHGTVVMHKCDNRACVNPSHLMLGSQYDNVRDMMDKHRDVRNPRLGVKHHNTRLTEEDIEYIFNSNDKIVDKARKLGYHRATISKILNGQTWKHLKRSKHD